MYRGHAAVAVAVVMTALILAASGTSYAARLTLPAKAAEAIKAAFPNAAITSIGRERENGVMYYEVNLKQNGQSVEVEVTPDGVIGEIEAKMRMESLPKDIRDVVAKATAGGRRIRIEKHERRGRAQSGRFVPLAAPKVTYEVKYYLGNRRCRFRLDGSEVSTLPARAKAAIESAFPKAVVTDTELEYEDGVKLYEVALTLGGRKMDVKLSPKGTILEIETKVGVNEVPKAAMQAIRQHAKGGRVEEIEKVELRGVVKSGRLVKLRQPKIFFEAEVARDGREAEIKVAPDGSLVEKPEWKDDEDEDDEEDDDD